MSPLLRLTVSLVSPGLAHVHSILTHTVLAGLYITQNKILINIYWALSHLRAVDSHVLSPFPTGTRPISCPLRALVLSVLTHLVATLVTGLHAVQAHIVLPLSRPAVSLVEFFNSNNVTLMNDKWWIHNKIYKNIKKQKYIKKILNARFQIFGREMCDNEIFLYWAQFKDIKMFQSLASIGHVNLV